MMLTVDEKTWEPKLPAAALGDLFEQLQGELATGGRVIVRVELDGQVLDGAALTSARTWPVDQRAVRFMTADRGQLARSMVGKVAALIEYLNTQHGEIAQMLEQNQSAKALEKLASALSAWDQIQQAFASTLTLLRVDVNALMVGQTPAADLIADFCTQLSSIHEALKNHDLVLLADILQYEMETAVTNWVGMLEATVATIESPEHAAAR